MLFQSSFQPAKFTSLSSQLEKIFTVGAKCFRCAEVLFQLPDGNIIIVGAKRFRCLGQCADTPRSVLLLSIGSGASVWSPEAFSLLVPNASVTQKYCSSKVTVQHEVCRLHLQRAVHHVVLSPSTTVFHLFLSAQRRKGVVS